MNGCRWPALALAALLSACGGDGRQAAVGHAPPPAHLGSGARGSANIEYQSNVRTIALDEARKALMAASTDGWTLVFVNPSAAITALKAGDVLLIKGLIARRVLDVYSEGEYFGVLTGAISIGEVIRSGHITLNAPIRFITSQSAARAPAAQPVHALLDAIVPSAAAAAAESERLDKAERQGTRDAATRAARSAVVGIFSGWKTRYTATPGPNRVDLSVILTRQVGGFRGAITATGYLADFDVSADLDVENGTLERLEVAFRRVNGLMNVEWEVGKDTPGGFNEQSMIKLPGAISIPLYQFLEGFPLYLEIGAAAIVQPVITGGMQYSSGAFSVTYEGTQHLQARPHVIDPEGKVDGSIAFTSDRHISAVAPVGMIVSFALPRIELTMSPLRVLHDLENSLFAELNEKDIFGATRDKGTIDRALGWADRASKLLTSRMRDTPLANVTPHNIAEAMKSDASAYMQVVISSAVSNSGFSVIEPCTRTDLGISISVGASAQAFGRQVGRVSKIVFEKKLQRLDPPQARLCS